jgi:hypothetical protein
MAILLKVTLVDQSGESEPPQRIRRIGGETGAMHWKHTQTEAIEAIERGQFVYYIETNNHPFRLGVARTPDGQKYLTIQQDSEQIHLLLDLPGFPNPGDSAAN